MLQPKHQLLLWILLFSSQIRPEWLKSFGGTSLALGRRSHFQIIQHPPPPPHIRPACCKNYSPSLSAHAASREVWEKNRRQGFSLRLPNPDCCGNSPAFLFFSLPRASWSYTYYYGTLLLSLSLLSTCDSVRDGYGARWRNQAALPLSCPASALTESLEQFNLV